MGDPTGDEQPPSEATDGPEPLRMPRWRFEELVSDALDRIPAALAREMRNVAVLVADRHPDEPDLLGLYEGIALTERTTNYSFVLPDRITIYQDAILDECADEDEVVHEVLVTVVHEVAHHFGLDDDTLHELGWG
jgi:predicted Zn-dependent protease with MMP-like domain